MNNERYQTVLVIQYFLLAIDLFFNSFSELLKFENVILLVLYVIQDICILFTIIVVFLMFFNTYIFQAGLVVILINKFKLTIIVTFVYLILCLALHVFSLTIRWSDTKAHVSNPGFWILFGIQRVGAVFHYYFYKRAALALGDPRFFQDSEWIHKELEKQR